MNVSESIDWQHSTPSELFLHRCRHHEERPDTGRLPFLLPPKRLVDPPGRGQPHHRHQTGRQRQPHTQHRTLPLHQRAQGDKMKEITLITTDFYISVLGGTR